MNNTMRIHDIYRPVDQRRNDFREVEHPIPVDELTRQAERCMDCGIPFCHGTGCPLGNVIPEFNAAVAAGDLMTAYRILSQTSFFPEFTARICPALCEGSCTHGIDDEAVMIRQIEKHIIETAFASGWVVPNLPPARNGLKIAVIGSGPAGLAAAEALNRKGYSVTVYEKDEQPGGLLRYGIPYCKLDKSVIDRRLEVMRREGIKFICGANIGADISPQYLKKRYAAIVLAVGTQTPRDLPIPGRDLKGIHFALEFLGGQNRAISGELKQPPISAKGKRVLVIGGGDTGSDCVGTAIRQGAASVTQIEIMPKPPVKRSPSTPWPMWPYLLRTSSSHKEGCERMWNLSSKRFLGVDGAVRGVEVATVEWETTPLGKPLRFQEVADTNQVLPADLVLLAMGYTGVPEDGVVAGLGLERTKRTTIVPKPQDGIFAVGDCANGASLVVRAIADAKLVADRIDDWIRNKQ